MADQKINIAYKEVLVYDSNNKIYYPNSNLANYKIHTWYTAKCDRLHEVEQELGIKFPYQMTNSEDENFCRILGQFNSQKFEGFFDDTFNVFETYSLDDAIEKDINFIYPIILFTNDLYHNYTTVDFDDRLVNKVLEKKAKICFIQLTEGFFGSQERDFVWLTNLSSRYNFDKDHLIFITANLKTEESKKKLLSVGAVKDNFTIIPYSYFQHNLWFFNCGKMSDNAAIEKLKHGFTTCIEGNKINKKNYHFLCFNNLPKLHRIAIFGELNTNEAFRNKFITSLGSSLVNRREDYLEQIYNYINHNYKHGKNRLIDFFRNYDSTKVSLYDESDREINKATTLNMIAHNDSFVNIVTESLIHPSSIFFSEKLFKPIFCAQPFILLGNPNSLRKLKEYGFQTFDRWWDESYDTESDFTRRLEKVVDIMIEISTWDQDKMYKITNEMESILHHNFLTMIKTDEIYETYKKLYF